MRPAARRGCRPRKATVVVTEGKAQAGTGAATPPACSRAAAHLSRPAAGWVAVSKGRAGRRPLTWLALTAEGRAVYQRHLAALRAIAGGGGARHVPDPAGAVPGGDTVFNGVVSPSCHDDGHEHT
ncbi:transcriptional regulator [Streptomyces chrestomyceticus]|uniref:transcriptional regulator n=1 Tax=Streptomyces chrestomyceticus TaxID=68185 RepID=UPI0037B122DA